MADRGRERRFSIERLRSSHRQDWEALYDGYARFYRSPQTAEMRERVWSWLHDEDHELAGRIGLDDSGRGVGLVHYRPFSRPLAATTGGFIDDLFVTETSRGTGLAEALVDAVVAEGRRLGWSAVRWITAEDNYRGRGFYDRIAAKTHWVTYQIPLA